MDFGLRKIRSRYNYIKSKVTEKVKSSGGEFFWITIGQVAAVLAGLVGVRMLTELMSPQAYGRLALGMTIATLFQQIGFKPFGQATLRFYPPAQESNSVLELERHAYRIGGYIVAILLVSIPVVVVGLLLLDFEGWALLFSVSAAFSLFRGINGTFDGIQNAARYRIVVASHKGAFAWLRFLIAASLILLTTPDSWVALTGYVIASAIICISQVVLYWQKIRKPAIRREREGQISGVNGGEGTQAWSQRLWDYGWPFAVWGIFTWFHVSSDRWALQAFAGEKAVGLYTVLYQLGFYPLTFLSGVVSKFIAPILYERAGDATEADRIQNAYRLNYVILGVMFFLTFIFSFAAYIFHPSIFQVFVGEEYRSASNMLPYMVLAGGLFATSNVVGFLLKSQANSRKLIIPKVSTALIGAALNVVGAYYYGTIGIILSLIIFGLVNMVWTYIVSGIKK